jgi:hypothetical protein
MKEETRHETKWKRKQKTENETQLWNLKQSWNWNLKILEQLGKRTKQRNWKLIMKTKRFLNLPKLQLLLRFLMLMLSPILVSFTKNLCFFYSLHFLIFISHITITMSIIFMPSRRRIAKLWPSMMTTGCNKNEKREDGNCSMYKRCRRCRRLIDTAIKGLCMYLFSWVLVTWRD